MNMLNLAPFSFGCRCRRYDDGQVFSPSMLDITDEVWKALDERHQEHCCSLPQDWPPDCRCCPSPSRQRLQEGCFGCLATEYSFPEADKIKHRVSQAAAAPVAAAAGSKSAAPVAAAAPAEPSEDSDEEMGLDLFA